MPLSWRSALFLFVVSPFLFSGCSSGEDQVPSDRTGEDPDGAGAYDGSGGANLTPGSGGAGSGGAGDPGSGSSMSAGGTPSASGGAGESTVLSQGGNPVYELLKTYEDWREVAGDAAARLAVDSQLADNILSWQLPHGGFYKNAPSVYDAAWNGSDARSGWTGEDGVELGTIDNEATVTELMFLADVYRRSGDAAHRGGASAALDFLLTMQYGSGGFPQVYPARTGTTYSNHVTFNDDAMARVLILLHQIVREVPPFDGDTFTAEQRGEAVAALEGGVAYILAAQIEQNGAKTVWCAQHDPDTGEAVGARSYELPSKSGKESVGVVSFLMTQLQTDEVRASVQAALAWYRSSEVIIEDTIYRSRPSDSTDDNYNPIQSQTGSNMWCRFYDLTQDTCFFSGRLPTDEPPGTGKQYDIMAIEAERRYGYQWGGGYGAPLLSYAQLVGY